MKLISLSLSHRALGLGDLERVSLAAAAVGNLLCAQAGVEGVVVLETCNRFEVYLETQGVPTPDVVAGLRRAAARHIAASSGLSPERIVAALGVHAGSHAVRHLFEVASGLDSMIVGEREIAGQVRRALAAARDAGTTSARLEQAFQQASRVSRQVETVTGLGASGRSIVSVGLDLVADGATRSRRADDAAPASRAALAHPGTDTPGGGKADTSRSAHWADLRVLLIGTGSYAGATVAALGARGACDIRVFSSSGRATEFAAARGLTPVGAGDLISALADTDVVVSCAGTLDGALDAAAIRAAWTIDADADTADPDAAADAAADAVARPRTLTILDLALRRDVAPDVTDVVGVRLLDLDAIARHAPAVGVRPIAKARELIDSAVGAFADRTQSQAAARAAHAQIEYLRGATEAAIGAQVERLRNEIDCADRVARGERAIRREAGARLHRDIMALKGVPVR